MVSFNRAPTTLLQVVEAILAQGNSVAAFVPLSEWSSLQESFFQSIVRRDAFAGAKKMREKTGSQRDNNLLTRGYFRYCLSTSKFLFDGLAAFLLSSSLVARFVITFKYNVSQRQQADRFCKFHRLIYRGALKLVSGG